MPHQWEEGWVCPACKQARGPDGHDPCIANLPGVLFACCGHGGHGHNGDQGYIYFQNGVRIGMVVTDVSYDDNRSRVNVARKRRR